METSKVTGLPVARTKCRYCGEDIIYHVYKQGAGGEKAPVPRSHHGHCAAMLKLGYAKRTIEKHERRRHHVR